MNNKVGKNERLIVVGGIMPGLHSNAVSALENQVAKITVLLERHHAECQQLAMTQATHNIGNDASLASIQSAVADFAESLRLQDRQFLSVSEAAHLANMKPSTIRKRLVSGELKGCKGGDSQQDHWRISRRDLDRFLERNSNQAKPKR